MFRLSIVKTRRTAIKRIAASLALLIFVESVAPTVSYALTSGPTQPEAAQFMPVGANDMVDISTGDFGYNIPLFELPGPNGGYPFNLSYQSGPTIDQEATWVGLGWNVNAGSIVRNMRGLPDEFAGDNDKVSRTLDMLPNETYGGGMSINFELAGADWQKGFGGANMSLGIKVYENTYKGIGYTIDIGSSFSAGQKHGMSGSAGMNLSIDSQDGVGANANVSMSMTHANDANLNCATRTDKTTAGLGIGFHSSGGLNATTSSSHSALKFEGELNEVDDDNISAASGSSRSGSSTISFSSSSYTPSIGMEMTGYNLMGHFSIGPAVSGNFPYFNFNGFYSVNKVAKPNENVPAYGYMHYQDQGNSDDDARAMTDVNREKDGAVYKTSTNLYAPSHTYDFYVINGQGAGGMFRPYRQELGYTHEQRRVSSSAGGSIGFDAGVPGHFGISGSFNYARTLSGNWDNGNDALGKFDFRKKGYKNGASNDDRFEGVYFKLSGERAATATDELSGWGETAAVRLRRNGHKLTSVLEKSAGSYVAQLNEQMARKEKRTPRATVITPYTNGQIMSRSSTFKQEVLREYNIQYYEKGSINNYVASNLKDYSDQPTNRGKTLKGNFKDNHFSGITVTQPDGKRYVYALPAQNNVQVQRTFSVDKENYGLNDKVIPYGDYHVDKTEQFNERTEMPSYPHSFLLTSVLGDDYVDDDNVPGPSDGDLGYWVKFNYVKTSSEYKWRAPIGGAYYAPGNAGSSMDDKGYYTYGTKEIWYLATVETKTHIAVFTMEERLDGLGPSSENMLTTTPGLDNANKLYALKDIKLYAKADYNDPSTLNPPLQTINFRYKYELCPGTPNSLAPGGKKLTLDSLFFTSKWDQSGKYSPYIFGYSSVNKSYDYLNGKSDRWGNYRTYDYDNNNEFPYTPQFDPDQDQGILSNKTAFKQARDEDASTWNLTSVKLPSGGTMKIEYEMDDYAFVQHKKAAQMFRIEGLGVIGDDEIYSGTGTPSEQDRRIYFKLEDDLPGSVTTNGQKQDFIIENYLGHLYDKKKEKYNPVYAKFLTNMRGSVQEYISGYYNLKTTDDKPVCGVVSQGSQDYGYIVLDFFSISKSTGTTQIDYHPFAVNAWQTMRVNTPRLMTSNGDFDFESGEGNGDLENMTRIGSYFSWVNTIATMFSGYRFFCASKGFSKNVDLGQSFVRLDTPDGFKYGGGCRVKKLYVENDPVFGNEQIGQVYDYTTTVGRGTKRISSGVASYEPSEGGEENPFRTAKMFDQHMPFHTDNNLFFEYPVNESYYPAAKVVYSKVTVTSLATYNVQKAVENGDAASTYQGIQTTGRTVHEFYTARDFPTFTEETDISIKNDPYMIPLPFIGMINVGKLTATQGYAIILNDMHGKPKSVTTYASVADGQYSEVPLTSVRYIYKQNHKTYEGEHVFELENKVKVLTGDPHMNGRVNNAGADAKVEDMVMGVEYDLFTDFRHSQTESGTGGLDFNMDIMGAGVVGFPLPFPWPSFNFSHESTRLAVMNKIVHKAGILERVIATDAQSTVVTKNEVFDRYTGQPLLTSVNNNYDKKIFKYDYPAYMSYSGTGAAYENILMEFTGTLENTPQGWKLLPELNQNGAILFPIINQPGNEDPTASIPQDHRIIPFSKMFDYLEEGDEFIFDKYTENDPQIRKYFSVLTEKRKNVLYGEGCKDEKVLLFDFPKWGQNDGQPVSLKNGQRIRGRFLLVRSGKRNLLGAHVGSVVSLNTSTDDGISASPLYSRSEKTFETTNINGYTQELAGFLKQILDCNGRFPLGQYDFDHPRFFDTDGNIKYPRLNALFEGALIVDNCGGQQCLTSVYQPTTTSVYNSYTGWNVICENPIITPNGYNSPIVTCSSPIPTPAQVSTELQNGWQYILPCQIGGSGAFGGLLGAIIGAAANWDIEYDCDDCKQWPLTYCPGHVSCYEHKYNQWHANDPWHIEWQCAGWQSQTTIQCAEPCLSCNAWKDKNYKDPLTGETAFPGYHMILKFRDGFKDPNTNKDCMDIHCMALSKYEQTPNSGIIKNTSITNVAVLGNNIQFTYKNSLPQTTSDLCLPIQNFQITQKTYGIKDVLQASAVELSPYKVDSMHHVGTCGQVANIPPRNMYTQGNKGIWRPHKTYYYNDERFQAKKTTASANMTSMLNIASDGVFDGDIVGGNPDRKFYFFNWSSSLTNKIMPNWIINETVTEYNKSSQGVEAKDVLNLYSAVLFDRFNNLPVAVGNNMRATEMFYENFENTNCIDPNYDNNGTNGMHLGVNIAFSGKKSMNVTTVKTYKISREHLQLIPGKKYILSAWAGGFNTLFSPQETDARFGHLMNINIRFYDKAGGQITTIPGNTGSYVNCKPSGKIMEGLGSFWRKVEKEFTVPTNTWQVELEFTTTGHSNDGANELYGKMYMLIGNQAFIDQRACYDDIRIFPSDGLMKTYVYDEADFRLMAESDENNYPAIYGYTPSGSLMVVKKLTEEGLKTLKEIRSNTRKRP